MTHIETNPISSSISTMDHLQNEVSQNPWATPIHEIPSITLNDTNVIFQGDAYRLEYFPGSASDDDNAREGLVQWNSGSKTDVDSIRTGRSRSIRRSATIMDANRTNFSHDSGFGVVASRRSRSRSESPPPDPYAHIAVYPQRFLFNFDDPRHDVEHTFDRALVRQAWTDREWNKQAREMMDALKLVIDKPAEIDDDINFNSDDDVDDDEYRIRKDKRARKTTDEILRKYASSAHARLKRQQEERWATCVDILYAIEAFDRGIMSKSFALRTLFGLMQQNGVDACTPDCPCRGIEVPPPPSVSQAEYDCAFKSTAPAVPDPHPNLPFEHPIWDPVLSLCQTIGEYTDQAVAAARNYATRFVTACRRAKATYDEELIHRHWRRTRRVVAQEAEEWDQYGVRHTYHMAYLPL